MPKYLGRQAKDTITGFEGTCTGHAKYLSGCSQVLIAPPVDKEGALRDSAWFDEQRIEWKDEPAIELDNERTPGPDSAAPKR